MVNKQAIYRKTPKGSEAIANRQAGLVSPKLRSVLIMVDGKRSYIELAALTTALGDCEQLLSQLMQDGLIETDEGAFAIDAVGDITQFQMAATVPAPLEATPPAPIERGTLSGAKRFTSQLLVEMLGPTSDVLCMKVESAASIEEFVSVLRRTKSIVRDIKGTSAAERFMMQVELYMPQT